ncbi:luciferase [Halomarina salina]|uniref:Luciferase n=1 Tax=Halomarina salina TaxID=1872699 RepID=A0ABD5RJI7_9EURY|nr:luciferase [Halomarina salina]
MLTSDTYARTGLDALALKPTEHDLDAAAALDVDVLALDYEGREALPGEETLRALAADRTLLLTAPVRADGFDPLGDDGLLREVPAEVGLTFVAGHGAYLTAEERARAIAPRLRAALDWHAERSADADRTPATKPWVGTESIERVALAAGDDAVQYDLLDRSTAGEVRAMRRMGYEGDVAVYAPTLLTDDEDVLLDALGGYVARRGPVRAALPDGAATDGGATGRAREVLVAACRDYALAGTPEAVGEQVASLHEAGVDTVVGYPARGLDAFR